MKLPLHAALAASLVLAACEGGDRGEISREQFIRANVALRTVSDTAQRVDSLRAQALRKQKVTAEQLRAWLKANEPDPVVMADTWTEISRRVEAADSARRPPPPPLPPPSGIPGPQAPVSAPAPPPPPVIQPAAPAPAPAPPPAASSQTPEPPPPPASPKVRDTTTARDSAGAGPPP